MQTLSTKNLYIIGGVSLALGLLFNYFFFQKQIGISFFVYIFLSLACLFVLLGLSKTEYNKAVLWYLPPIIFFSAMAAIRDNGFLLFCNILAILGLLLLMANHIGGKSIKDYLLSDYVKTAVMLPLNMLAKSFGALGRMLTIGRGLKENQKSSQIAKGIIITLPILVFFFGFAVFRRFGF